MESEQAEEKLVHRDMDRTCGVASGTVHVHVGSRPAMHLRTFKRTEPIIVTNDGNLPVECPGTHQSI